MTSRRPNPKRVKIHRSYTVEEAARLLGVHRNTVRRWIKTGLSEIDQQRPTLIHGQVLAEFLDARRAAKRRPCAPGQIYCVRCREPRRPADGRVGYRPVTPTSGNLAGVCPACNAGLFRRVNLAKMNQVLGSLTVFTTEAARHIADSARPSVNSDISKEATTNE